MHCKSPTGYWRPAGKPLLIGWKALIGAVFSPGMTRKKCAYGGRQPRARSLHPSHFDLPRTVRKLLKRSRWRITANQAFEQVQAACAEPREDDGGTWIDEELLHNYPRLFRAGRAICVEVWDDDSEAGLIGGFYGVLIGSALFGESMFSRVSNASKLAFASAAPLLFELGIELIDCQMHTEHLAQFGCYDADRQEFESRLRHATEQPPMAPLPGVIR